jgi:hypothetical protein
MGANDSGQLGNGSFQQPGLIVPNGVTAVAAGRNHSIFLKSDGSLWAMGDNQHGEAGDGTFTSIYGPKQILAAYNQVSCQLTNGAVRFSFVGIAGVNYALDRSLSLSPPNWVLQATNSANSYGVVGFTNTPDATTNNFWRIHSLP